MPLPKLLAEIAAIPTNAVVIIDCCNPRCSSNQRFELCRAFHREGMIRYCRKFEIALTTGVRVWFGDSHGEQCQWESLHRGVTIAAEYTCNQIESAWRDAANVPQSL